MRYALKTFGSSGPKRRHFDTIDELEHDYAAAGPRGQAPTAGLYVGEPRPQWVAEVQGGTSATSGHDTMMGRTKGTGDSDEEAIIQTRTASVNYDHSPPH